MTEEHLKCPKCGFEFDYYYSVAYSLSSLKISQFFRAECPRCHRTSIYHTSIDIRNPGLYRSGMIASLVMVIIGIFLSVYFLASSLTYLIGLPVALIASGIAISFGLDLQNRRP